MAKFVLFCFASGIAYFIGSLSLRDSSRSVAPPSDTPRVESFVAAKQAEEFVVVPAPLTHDSPRSTPSEARVVVERALSRSERPKDWTGDVNDMADGLVKIT